MNKKGEKLMVFWWFLACTLVFLVLILTAINFYAKPVDVRELQTQITFSNIYDCLVEDSFLKPEVLKKDFDFISYCSLRNQQNMQDLNFFISVDLLDKDTKLSLLSSSLNVGDKSLLNDCEIASKLKTKYFPSCLNNSYLFPIYYSSNEERKTAFFNVVIASQYYGERVSVLKPIGLNLEEDEDEK